MESFRRQDTIAEKRLGDFMDEFFYSKLKTNDGQPVKFKRMTDKESQQKGIDVCLEVAGRTITIDEKASIYYSNAMIPTFAFELDSIQKGYEEPIEGWFVNDDLETQFYMLIWPNVKCVRDGTKWIRKEISEIRKEDFTIVESMLIKKKNIRIELENNGYDKSHLIEYAKRYRKMCASSDSNHEEKMFDGVKIMFSGHLAERPINLVIRKELLYELAERIYLISQDGYASIKG